MKEINRKNNFAILHFFGACLVVYGHQYAIIGQPIPAFLGSAVSTIGVKMIFVITGFLITQSFMRSQTPSEFLKRRLIRIFPALAFCLIVTTLAFSLISSVDFRTYFRLCFGYLFRNLFLYPIYHLPGVFECNPYPHAVNGSLWTVPVEVAMYLALAFTLWLLGKFGARARKFVYFTLVALMVALEGIWDVLGVQARIVVYGTDWFTAMDIIPYMLIGSLFEIADLKKYCNLQVGVFALLVACCLKTRFIEPIVFIVLPYFTMSFALCEKPIFSGFFEKNNIAYGVFLWGFPIQQLLVYLLYVNAGLHWSANVLFMLSMLPIVICALFSAHYVERPVERFLRKKLLHRHNAGTFMKEGI